MPQWAVGPYRSAVQWLVPTVLAALAGWHIRVPDGVAGYLVALAMAGGVAAYTAAARWLESRPSNTPEGRLARAVARVMLAGAPPLQGSAASTGSAGAVG
jgi:hypothetical protein